MNTGKSNKKMIVIIAAIVVIIVGVIVGIVMVNNNKKKGKDDSSSGNAANGKGYDVYEYVTVGDYKGVKVNSIIPEVTDKEVQDKIDALIEANKEYKEVKNRGMKSGDKVKIDFVGKIDGKEFEGGSAEDYEYEVGTGGMIEGFDEGLFGTKTGEKVDLNLTFPEDYQTADVAGKDVVFKVTVKAIQEVSKLPEWNDAFAKKASEGKFNTAKEYETSIKEDLLKTAKSTSKDTLKGDVWNSVFLNMKIEGYPKSLYDEMYKSVSASVENSAAQWGMKTEDYLNAFAGMTLKEYVKRYVESQMVSEALIDTIDIKISEKEYKEMSEDYLTTFGVASAEELEKNYGKKALQEYFKCEKLYTYLVDEAKITEITKAEYEKLKTKEQ